MKHFYATILSVITLSLSQFTIAQSGPNLLGAKGTFSAPFITVNPNASSCIGDGSTTYSPIGNIGNALNVYGSTGNSLPASAYDYTASQGGLNPEFTYTIIKNIGDANGGNCIKPEWRGQDHTGDGGYFMAVNGAPNTSKSPIFYQIKSIPVCAGTKYEFSAWVLNILPKNHPAAIAGSEPNISFKVISSTGSQIIGTSGPIAYTTTPTWVKVSGIFIASATDNTVDLQVINATAVAQGNDLGLDDISFNVIESNITLTGANGGAAMGPTCEGASFAVNFKVTDVTHTNVYYKWQVSKDGGANYVDSTLGGQLAIFSGDSYTLPLVFNNVTTDMNGYKYKLVVSTSLAGLSNPVCTNVNEYTLIVNACAPTPVTLTAFNGKYNNNAAYLDWQTSQEINNDHFELYKSTDGQTFSQIAIVKGAGYSNLVKNYSFIDNSVGNSAIVYYRLKQIDGNGKFTYSSIVRIATGGKMGIEVFPNPFVNNFTASFTANKNADAELILRNSVGQPVMRKTIKVIKGSNSINVTSLPSLNTGMYYLSISNDDINYINKLQKN